MDNPVDAIQKHAGGRPPKYTDAKQLQTLIDAYFKECEANEKPYTITGLALALDLTRETLLQYEGKQELSATIKKAKEKVRNSIEEKLLTTKTSPVGMIFWLKNNAGWKDTQETHHTGAIQHGFVALPPLVEPVKIEPKSVSNIITDK